MKTEPNQSAFPCDGEYASYARMNGEAGLTKREYFVAAALTGYIAAGSNGMPDASTLAAYAVDVANEVISLLNKEPNVQECDATKA